MKCDIIIPVWNLKEYTQKCVESLIKNTDYSFRLIMVDNGSEKETKEYLESLKADTRLNDYALIRNEKNLGYTKATNQGMKIAASEYVCLLNNDTLLLEGWLSEMIKVAESADDIGIVNPSSNNLGDYKPWRLSLENYALELRRKYSGQYIEMATAIGFCFLIKREVIEKLGILSDEYGDGNFEDTEYAIRAMRNGYKSVIARGSYVYHREHASFNMIKDWEDMFVDNQKLFHKLFGSPKRILYVLTKENKDYFKELKQETYDLASKCNWVTVFIKDSIPKLDLAEHTNIRIIGMMGAFFRWRCVHRVLIKKKRYSHIFTDDKKLFNILKRSEGLHKAEVKCQAG
ncbi:glycosyltransferase family 2 protein [Candidatus Omnitrophota bacterium]